MSRRRRSRSGPPWKIVGVIVVVVGLVIGLGFYGTALGLPDFLHPAPAAPSALFTVSNVTLTSLPSIEDGDAGLTASGNIANHWTAKIENTTFTVNTIPLGTCTTVIQPGSQAFCKTGEDVSCDDYPAAPYAIKVTIVFLGGATYSTTQQITSTLTVDC